MTVKQTILMCAPEYFGVDYVINPWMQDGLGKTDAKRVNQQWHALKDALAAHVNLAFVPPVKGLPDMVFTANAGMVLGTKAIVSRFRSKERQSEEVYFKNWFQANGFQILEWPQEIAFEGAGDALFDRGQPIIWAGYGFRSDDTAPKLLEKFFDRRTLAVRLVDPRFYHLDTCLCPLAGGYLMYFPSAFDPQSQALIAEHVPDNKRIIVAEDDALHFSCNAVDVNKHVFMNSASDDLRNQLTRAGFTPILTPLTEFLKSGGAAKCLTLKLVEE